MPGYPYIPKFISPGFLVSVLVLMGSWLFASPLFGQYITFSNAQKPVKVVVLGDSIAAYPGGNFTNYMAAVCRKAEFTNISIEKFGAKELYERFVKLVIQNQTLQKAMPGEKWLLFHGGVNSVDRPVVTNRYISKTFQAAKEIGMGRVGLTLTPWGDPIDWRWKEHKAILSYVKTKMVVDFVMGRSGPKKALRFQRSNWLPGELPDISVDLYDSPLRETAALPYPPGMTRLWVQKAPGLQKVLKRYQGPRREKELRTMVKKLSNMPKWQLARAYRTFDHVHVNGEGHRIIAQETCTKAPDSWGCGCDRIAQLKWVRGRMVQSYSHPSYPQIYNNALRRTIPPPPATPQTLAH